MAAEGVEGLGNAAQVVTDYSWMSAFLGDIPGSFGEVSTLAIFLGGAVLLLMGIASWRVVLGVFWHGDHQLAAECHWFRHQPDV